MDGQLTQDLDQDIARQRIHRATTMISRQVGIDISCEGSSPRASATRMVENTPKPQKPVIRDTLLFRVFNPELYIPYNRWIAGIGSVVCAAAIAKVAYLKYEHEAEKSRETRR